MNRARTILALAAASALLATVPASAAPGALDPTFSGDGLAALSPPTRLLAAAPTADGRTVVAGQTVGIPPRVLLARVNNAGGIDYAALGSAGVGRAIAVQPDGKLVVAGTAPSDGGGGGGGILVDRFNADGSRDGSFGAGGAAAILLARLGGQANAVAIQSDGKIVVAGSVLAGDGQDRMALARLNPNGTPDTTFGFGGATALSRVSPECQVTGQGAVDCLRGSVANGVAVQADGKIVLAGSTTFNLQSTDGLVVRVNANGVIDSSFSGDGLVRVPGFTFGGAHAELRALILQGDGRIVAAGGATVGPNPQNIASVAVLARLTTAGEFDGSFSGDGIATFVSSRAQLAPDPVPGAEGVALANGGNIVAGGTFVDFGLREFEAIAVTPSGAPAGFGSGGIAVTAGGGSFDAVGHAVAVGPDGKLVVVGALSSVLIQNATAGLLARYDGFGALPVISPVIRPAPSLAKIVLKFGKGGVSVGKDRRARFTVRNGNTGSTLRITLRVVSASKLKPNPRKRRKKVIVFGSVSKTVPGDNKNRTFTLRLSKTNAALLARYKRVRVRVTRSARGIKGSQSATTFLKAPKPKRRKR